MAAPDESVSLRVGDRDVPVEIFTPRAGEPPYPGVVVIHELFGLNDDIRRIARRFADNGYVAAAPDLLVGGARLRCVTRALSSLRAGSGPAVDDLDAAVGMLEGRADVGKVGAVGFCLGGGFALVLACRERVPVAGVYYGETRPREEIARACPLVGGYGARDRGVGPKGRKLIATLDELGKEHDVRLYEDAGHSYMNQAGHRLFATVTQPLLHVEYNERAAEDSWRRMLAFFERHLASDPA